MLTALYLMSGFLIAFFSMVLFFNRKKDTSEKSI